VRCAVPFIFTYFDRRTAVVAWHFRVFVLYEVGIHTDTQVGNKFEIRADDGRHEEEYWS